MRRCRPIGKLRDQSPIVETVPHMHQIELTDAQVSGMVENAIEMHVGRVRTTRQAVGDPHVRAFIERRHIVRQVTEIYRISDGPITFAETQAERGRRPMRLSNEAKGSVSEALLWSEQSPVDNRPIEVALLEGISEAMTEARQRFSRAV